MSSKCSKLKCNHELRRAVSLWFYCKVLNFWLRFYNNIDCFHDHFRWRFPDNRAREIEKNKLCHHPVISMVCMVGYIDCDQSAREESSSYGKMPNFMFYQPCVHTTTDVFFAMQTWIFFSRIQAQESFLVAFDRVRGWHNRSELSKNTRSLFIFLDDALSFVEIQKFCYHAWW